MDARKLMTPKITDKLVNASVLKILNPLMSAEL